LHNWIFSILQFCNASLVDALEVLFVGYPLYTDILWPTVGEVLASLPSQWVLNIISHWFKMFPCKSWSYEPFSFLVYIDSACILLFNRLEKISVLTIANLLHIFFSELNLRCHLTKPVNCAGSSTCKFKAIFPCNYLSYPTEAD